MPILDCLGGALVAYAANMVTVEVSGSIPENEIFVYLKIFLSESQCFLCKYVLLLYCIN